MAEPLILAFDTSDAHCDVALLRRDGSCLHVHEPMAKGQAERLLTLASEVLEEAGLVAQDLDAIAVGVGPGNFTGIRIGISAARGLALGLGIPAIGVTRFDALLHGTDGPHLACVDARRDMVFVQGQAGAPFADPALVPLADVTATGLPMVGSFGTTPAMSLAEASARIARQRLAAGPDHPRPRPLYLRAADAAPARDTPPVIVP